MLTKIVDEIMSAPEHFGEQTIHDLSVLEFTNPLQFEELCSSIKTIEEFIIERCPYSIECIRAVSYTHLTLPTNREV